MAVEYLLKYNRQAGVGHYTPDEDVFTTAVQAGADDGYKGYHGYDDELEAKYAAIARAESVRKLWPDLNNGPKKDGIYSRDNKYVYDSPRLFRREVGEWEDVDV